MHIVSQPASSPRTLTRRAGLALACWALMAAPAGASIIANHSWDVTPHPWTTMYNDVSLGYATTGGNPLGWMPITFPPTSEPEIGVVEWEEIIYVNREDLFAGNWAPNTGVAFDFFTSNALPQNLQLQFASTNGNVWGYNVTDQITRTQTWTTVNVNLGFAAAWSPLPSYSDTAEQFLADLAAIDWIGIYIFREAAGMEVYGMDNFRLLVPEPGQVALLASVLMAALANRRRRRVDDANAR